MLREASHESVAFAELEVGEVEARRDGAADQSPGTVAVDVGPEPDAGGHEHLRALASREIAADNRIDPRAAIVDLHHPKRRAGMMVPQFVARDSMQGREAVARHQEVDRGRSRPQPSWRLDRLSRAIRLAVEASLRVGNEVEPSNDVLDLGFGHGESLGIPIKRNSERAPCGRAALGSIPS